MTNYFSYFPTDYYIRNGESIEITDITKRFVFIEYLKKNTHLFYQYIIEDDDRVDLVANKLYDDYNLDWFILLVNGIFDSTFEWPMNYELFTSYLEKKYGSFEASTQQMHHYEYIYQEHGVDTDGNIIPEKVYIVDRSQYDQLIATQRRSVTCYEEEVKLNDSRRSIMVVRQMHINQVLQEVKKIFQQQVN
jgi:hypothetical protein